MHPYLQIEEHLHAFQQLTANPIGSVRKWEQMLGWKPGRLQRYLACLARWGLAKVESCHRHSVFRPLATVADRSVVMRSVAPEPGTALASNSLALKPKLASDDKRRKQRGRPEPPQPGTELLVTTMNESLQRFDSYKPIDIENWGSRRAARRWLVDEKIPLEEAVVLLRRAADAFVIDLAPGYDYPESIAYFSKIILAKWRAMQRSRNQLGLFPRLEMEVVRVGEYVPEPGGTTTPAVVSATMLDLAATLGVKR